MKQTINIQKEYPHPIQDVWDAITKQEALNTWFLPGDFRSEVGFHYHFKNQETKVRGEILEIEEPTLLVYTWIKGDTEIETTVRWMLQEIEGITRLSIEHSGIEKYEQSVPWLIKNTHEGWQYVVVAIENYLQG